MVVSGYPRPFSFLCGPACEHCLSDCPASQHQDKEVEAARQRERELQREREWQRENEIRELREFSSKLPEKLQQKLQKSQHGAYNMSGAAGMDMGLPLHDQMNMVGSPATFLVIRDRGSQKLDYACAARRGPLRR